MRTRFLAAVLACLLGAACGGGAQFDPPPPAPEGDAGPQVDPFAAWEAERAARQAALDAYLEAHAEGLDALLYAPLGDVGIPADLIEELPRAMPDIWGTPDEKYAGVGLGPDLYDPSNPLPLGIATYTLLGAKLANISCAACHVGRVVGPDGQVHLLIGAPNTQFNAIFTAFEASAADPRWDTMTGEVDDWLAKQALLLRRQVGLATIAGWTFSPARFSTTVDPFALDTPGAFDSFAVIFSMQLMTESLFGDDDAIAEVMPPAPADSDIMDLWLARDRPAAEWDGSLPDPVYRNLAAGTGAVAFGSATNLEAAIATSVLAEDLPPPPYPFDVDSTRAARGEALFEEYCASCHHAGATTIHPVSVIGTDPNRANSVTAAGRARLIAALRQGCTDETVCDVPDEVVVAPLAPPEERGYLALPLDGIWARAPYLHNGSVPTLHHLLVPESRPTAFVRGNIHYDEERVGFAWNTAEGAADAPYVHEYDTTRAGRSNRGHDDPAILGLDWAAHPEELADLLEYLKTL